MFMHIQLQKKWGFDSHICGPSYDIMTLIRACCLKPHLNQITSGTLSHWSLLQFTPVWKLSYDGSPCLEVLGELPRTSQTLLDMFMLVVTSSSTPTSVSSLPGGSSSSWQDIIWMIERAQGALEPEQTGHKSYLVAVWPNNFVTQTKNQCSHSLW